MNRVLTGIALITTILAVFAAGPVSAGFFGEDTLAFAAPFKLVEANTLSDTATLSWDPLKTPCPWNETWCVKDSKPVKKTRIMVDLGHAERITLDGAVSPNLDRSSNNRLFDWQDWAKDMRARGYTVSVITKNPVTPQDLLGADLFIVAQPDSGKAGPVYFSQTEKDAIACFVLRGNTLLVMAQQFMGGKDQTSFASDMKTTYASALVTNDLLEGIHVKGRFTEGNVQGQVLDLMDSDNEKTQVFAGKPPDIWLPADGLKPDMKPDTFAYFHGLSIVPSSVTPLVRADTMTFTSPKNSQYTPVIQPEGSRPVAIGVNGLGCGKVYLHGDPSAWQTKSFIGKIYANSVYHEQDAARVLVSRMLSFNRTCEPCMSQGSTQSNPVTSPTTRVTILRPRTTVTPVQVKSCDSCVDTCYNTSQGVFSSLLNCLASTCHVSGDITPGDSRYSGMDGGCSACISPGTPTSSIQYSECIKKNACLCPELPKFASCDDCLKSCSNGNPITCVKQCQEQFPKTCDCTTCLGVCKGNLTCVMQCTKNDGSPCESSGGGCLPCISGCDSKKDSAGRLLGGDSLKACYATCGGTGLCDKAWNTCKDSYRVSVNGVPQPTCYYQAMEDSTCNCEVLPEFCYSPCPAGTLVDVDGNTQCVAGTMDSTRCGSLCPAPQTGTLDACNYCRCSQRQVSTGCSEMVCDPGKTPSLVNGICTCQSMGSSGNVPANPQSSGCLDCYRNCSASSTTQKGSVTAISKTREALTSTCQKNCDTKYKTTLASCVCGSTQCNAGEIATPKSDFTCECVKTLSTGTGTISSGFPDYSSQWSEHHEGTPSDTSTSPTCRQQCVAWYTDPFRCARYEQVCT